MAGTSDYALVLGVLLAGVISGCGQSATAGGHSTGDAGQSGSVASAGSAAGAGGSRSTAAAGGSASSAGAAAGRSGTGAGGHTGNAGSNGRAGTGSAGSASAAGASGDPGVGGASGTDAAAGTGGMSGIAGASGVGGTVETPYSGWADACGDVTMNGHCVGETFEWCDYFARGLLRLDCSALGMRCRADERQAYEDERNGCVGAPCTGTIGHCDGSIGDGPIAVNCMRGEILANACRRQNGEGSVCTIEGEYQRARCSNPTCEDEWTVTCDGTAQVICDEEGSHRIVDCARCRPDGTCSVANPERPDCINYSFDCS
jgi:hypothetical protein